MNQKLCLYCYFGLPDGVEDHLMACLSFFKSGLIWSLDNEYQLIECIPSSDQFGKVWSPSLPCDGLILAPLYASASHPVRYEAQHAIDRVTRKERNIPVICFGLEGFKYSGKHAEPVVTIGVKHDLYRFIRLPGVSPTEAAGHVRNFFSEKFAEPCT